MSKKGRACEVCRKRENRESRMRSHLRHLHELSPGDSFRFPGKDEVLVLKSVTVGGANVSGGEITKDVEFETRYGEPVEFSVTRTRDRRVAPAAEVEPLDRVEN